MLLRPYLPAAVSAYIAFIVTASGRPVPSDASLATDDLIERHTLGDIRPRDSVAHAAVTTIFTNGSPAKVASACASASDNSMTSAVTAQSGSQRRSFEGLHWLFKRLDVMLSGTIKVEADPSYQSVDNLGKTFTKGVSLFQDNDYRNSSTPTGLTTDSTQQTPSPSPTPSLETSIAGLCSSAKKKVTKPWNSLLGGTPGR